MCYNCIIVTPTTKVKPKLEAFQRSWEVFVWGEGGWVGGGGGGEVGAKKITVSNNLDEKPLHVQ